VIDEMFQLSFRVFVCAFRLEISSFFLVRVSSFFSCCSVIHILVLSSPRGVMTYILLSYINLDYTTW
jgi:hypothetical protein